MTITLDMPVSFANDPIASHSAQFPLARPMDVLAPDDAPSPAGMRPWNLRGALVPTGTRPGIPEWRYDHETQQAVTADGRPLIQMAEPTAHSVSDYDGDEGKSEDWKYDYVPDDPGMPV
jgi:putative ATP-grasp target RiPP